MPFFMSFYTLGNKMEVSQECKKARCEKKRKCGVSRKIRKSNLLAWTMLCSCFALLCLSPSHAEQIAEELNDSLLWNFKHKFMYPHIELKHCTLQLHQQKGVCRTVCIIDEKERKRSVLMNQMLFSISLFKEVACNGI